MTDFPIDYIFFGRPTQKRVEGGEGITVRKNGPSKLTFINDNPYGLTKTSFLDGEILNIPSGFQLVVYGDFFVAAGADVNIEDGGALIIL